MKKRSIIALLLLCGSMCAQVGNVARKIPSERSDVTWTGNHTFTKPVTVATPTSDSHAASKKYVDDHSGEAGSVNGRDIAPKSITVDETGTNGDLFKAQFDANATDSPNISGHEVSHYGYGLLVRKTTTANAVLNYTRGSIGAYCAALAGGINRGSDEPGGWFKANYQCMGVTGTWRTPGQHAIMGASGNHYSIGDHFGFTTILTDWGGGSANGDESTQGFAARLYEGEAIFTATVSSVVSDTVNFSSGFNLDTLGEGRYLINTNASKTYRTGTVASVSGNVFTFTGAGLATKYGAGNKTNLCLALDSNTMTVGATPHRLVNLITNIADENTLTIKWGYPESGGNYPPRLATSGNYTIFPCSPVTYVGVSYQPGVTSGSIKVADPSVFVAGDTIELPVWYQRSKSGVTSYMKNSGYNQGSLFGGRFEGPGWLRNGIAILTGNMERGLEFYGGTIYNFGVLFNRTIGSNVPMLADIPPLGATNFGRRFLSTYDGLGSPTYLAFQQHETTGGYWYIGKTSSDFTVGNAGVGVFSTPQSGVRLSIKTLFDTEYGIRHYNSTDGSDAFWEKDNGDVYAAGLITASGGFLGSVHPSVDGIGKAFYGVNNGPGIARNFAHGTGNYQRGIEFSDGTIDTYGITFNKVLGDGTPFIQDVPQTGATTHNRKFFASMTGQGNQTYFGFQQNATSGGYWYAGRTNSAFTIGESGVGIGATPQNNNKLAIVTSSTSELGIGVWNGGSVKASINGAGVITGTKLTGITDTAVVTNLNADQVDGKSAIDFTAAPVAAPASATATCTAGQWSYATGYVYVCVATNTWQRASLTTW